MSFAEAVPVVAVILGKIGLLALVGIVGLAAAAWAWYRMDGGKMSLRDWLRGI